MTYAQETDGLCYRYESNREAPNSHKVLRPLVSDTFADQGANIFTSKTNLLSWARATMLQCYDFERKHN